MFREDEVVRANNSTSNCRYHDAEGVTYECVGSGYFMAGRLYGKGKATFPNGDVYDGHFKDT